MNERILQKRLKRLGIAVAVISAAILAAGSLASFYLRNILGEALTGQMKSDADQYRTNILRQMDADLQTLDTLGSLLQYKDAESLIRRFGQTKGHNDFEQISFYGSSGTEAAVALPDESVRTVIEEAWKGNSGVSRIYHEEGTGRNMFTCAVPVCPEGAVEGVHTASVSTDVFLDILQDDTILGRTGYVHLISDSGKVLVRSSNRIVSEDLDTIYDNGYILPEEKEEISRAMAEGEVCLSSFTYEGSTYQVLLEPVGVNGWYLFCVQTMQGASRSVYDLMTNMRLISGGILLLILVIIAYGYRLIRRGNHELIRNTYYDPLTGSYNRRRFEYEIGPLIKKSCEYSIAALNVRQFKFINEIFGSRAADELLCHISGSEECMKKRVFMVFHKYAFLYGA